LKKPGYDGVELWLGDRSWFQMKTSDTEVQLEAAQILKTDAILIIARLVGEEMPYNEAYKCCVDGCAEQWIEIHGPHITRVHLKMSISTGAA
jgi:hypothetical protein